MQKDPRLPNQISDLRSWQIKHQFDRRLHAEPKLAQFVDVGLGEFAGDPSIDETKIRQSFRHLEEKRKILGWQRGPSSNNHASISRLAGSKQTRLEYGGNDLDTRIGVDEPR